MSWTEILLLLLCVGLLALAIHVKLALDRIKELDNAVNHTLEAVWLAWENTRPPSEKFDE